MMSNERESQQVIAKYVRAADRRDGAAIAELFISNGNSRSSKARKLFR